MPGLVAVSAARLGTDEAFEQVYLGDRDYFLAQVDAKTDDPVIGTPAFRPPGAEPGGFSGPSR